MRSDLAAPNCCLLVNFFLLFSVSYVVGVIFLHYSASLVSQYLLQNVSVAHFYELIFVFVSRVVGKSMVVLGMMESILQPVESRSAGAGMGYCACTAVLCL